MTGLPRRQTAFLAIFLAITVFVSAFLYCDSTQYWGDDYAAYILEGKAIATGTMAQQHRNNVLLHPSTINYEDLDNLTELVYVWGYPLVLSIVYKLVGFDIDVPQKLMFYRLPALLSLGLFAAVLFLFFSRRFHPVFSAVLTLFIFPQLIFSQAFIETDFPFLCFSFVCFYLYEVFQDDRSLRQKILLGSLLGISMWYTYALRLNGFTIIVLLALQTLFYLLKNKPNRLALSLQLYPFALFLVLFLVCKIWMPTPTSNMADVGDGILSEGLFYYYDLLTDWLYRLTPFGPIGLQDFVYDVLKVLFIIGLVYQGWRKDFRYTFFLAATIVVNASLPYTQGIRYVYNILPFILMYIAYGILFLYRMVRKFLSKESYRTYFSRIAVTLLLVFGLTELITLGTILQTHPAEKAVAKWNAYAEPCMEVFHFIRNETDPSAVFAYMKPRALYLNTDRLAFAPEVNNHTIWDADYYLRIIEPKYWPSEELTESEWEQLQLVFSNSDFELYQVPKESQ